MRGDLESGCALQIAYGYHRVCAGYYTDENTDIPVVFAARESALAAARFQDDDDTLTHSAC